MLKLYYYEWWFCDFCNELWFVQHCWAERSAEIANFGIPVPFDINHLIIVSLIAEIRAGTSGVANGKWDSFHANMNHSAVKFAVMNLNSEFLSIKVANWIDGIWNLWRSNFGMKGRDVVETA